MLEKPAAPVAMQTLTSGSGKHHTDPDTFSADENQVIAQK
jgi:hypothetical protein